MFFLIYDPPPPARIGLRTKISRKPLSFIDLCYVLFHETTYLHFFRFLVAPIIFWSTIVVASGLFIRDNYTSTWLLPYYILRQFTPLFFIAPPLRIKGRLCTILSSVILIGYEEFLTFFIAFTQRIKGRL